MGLCKYTKPYTSNCLIEALRLLWRRKCNVFLIMTGNRWYSPLHFACLDRHGNFWHFRRIRGYVPPLIILGRVSVTSGVNLKECIFEKRVLCRINVSS